MIEFLIWRRKNLKKATKIIILQLLVIGLISFTFTNADFNVTIGTVYTYDIVESEWAMMDGRKVSSLGRRTSFSL